MMFSGLRSVLHPEDETGGSVDQLQPRRPRIGLALGAGVARGWAHIGILRQLDEIGFAPDIIVGTSVGAVVGGCYAAGALDDMEAFARSLTRRRVLSLMDLTFAGSGLIAGNRLKQRLERALGTMQIEDLPRKFAAVATEMGTGNEIWLTQGNLVEAVRASYALPGLFEPVRFGGRWLFDGALCNPIPVTVCRALGAEFVVAIDLVAEADRRSTVVSDGRVLNEALVELEAEAPKPSSSFLSGLSDRALRRLPFYASENGAPSMASAMIEAFNIIQDRLARSRLAGDPPDLQIAARVGKIGIFDFHRADELIQLGRDAVTKAATSLAERVGVPLLGPVSAS